MTAEGWLPLNREEFIARGACAEGDELLLDLELIRTAPNCYHPRRVLYEMSDDLWELYCQHRDEAGGVQ